MISVMKKEQENKITFPKSKTAQALIQLSASDNVYQSFIQIATIQELSIAYLYMSTRAGHKARIHKCVNELSLELKIKSSRSEKKTALAIFLDAVKAMGYIEDVIQCPICKQDETLAISIGVNSASAVCCECGAKAHIDI